MASVRISNNNNYIHHDKWPESDAKFLKAAAGMGGVRGGGRQPRVVDGVSCRQLYLRSAYTFSKKESVPEKTKKCFATVVREMVAASGWEKKLKSTKTVSRRKRSFPVVERVKKLYGSAVSTIFGKVLTCTTSVEVADHMH